MAGRGIFVGLSTIDIIYSLDEFPEKNLKITAQSQEVVVGGPATNAAVTFAFLGGDATLVSPVGQHAIASLIREECHRFGITLIDLTPESTEVPPLSSIWVNRKGERSVASVNTSRIRIPHAEADESTLRHACILMVDGHAIEAGQVWARAAKLAGIPVVLDGGSWKLGMERLLKNTDVAICSADFRPPTRTKEEDILGALQSSGITKIAVTRGPDSVRFASPTSKGLVDVPRGRVVDTTGAGDVFHGAFCFYTSAGFSFEQALQEAVRVASESCRYRGTREWMKHYFEPRQSSGSS